MGPALSPGGFNAKLGGGGRRPSLGGTIAETAERAGGWNESASEAMAGLMAGAAAGVAPKLGRRMSLADKVKRIREGKVSPPASPAAAVITE